MSELREEVNQLKNISQFIADKLEALILNGELKPGERLIQTEVAERFGVSRLPVRDAFALLIKKELVVNLPRKGVEVRRIDVEEVENLFELRLLIESYAVSKSLPHLKAEAIEEAKQLVKEQGKLSRGQFDRLLDIDESFHRILWSGCGNSELEEHLSMIWRRIKFIRAYARDIKKWKSASIENHELLLQAVETGDSKGAIRILKQGIERSRKEILDFIRELNQAA